MSNLHKTCSSPSIFAMAGDSSWKTTNFADNDRQFERRSDIYNERKYDIFNKQNQDRQIPGNDRFHQSEMNLDAAVTSDINRISDNRGSSYYSKDSTNTALTTSTKTTSTTTGRATTFYNKRDFSGENKETSPRKELSRSRDSSQSKTLSDYQSFKYQLLNQDRRPSQEENKVLLNPSGKILSFMSYYYISSLNIQKVFLFINVFPYYFPSSAKFKKINISSKRAIQNA